MREEEERKGMPNEGRKREGKKEEGTKGGGKERQGRRKPLRHCRKLHAWRSYIIGRLHDRANVKQTSSWFKQPYWNPVPWLKCRPRLSVLAHS